MSPKKVTVAGGAQLISNSIVPHRNFSIQGKSFSSSFKLLDLGSYDIILGADWIYSYSPICLDLAERILTLTKNGPPVTLFDHTVPKEKCIISALKLDKMLQKGVMGYILQTEIEDTETLQTAPAVPAELAPLLEKFKAVFTESTVLPPSRDCDHQIPLKTGAQPPDLRPYRVPHHQKAAMEEIIKKILQKCEIQASMSPFSSPAVMVRKKRWGMETLCGL